jgi:hypothetical protein
MYVNGFDGSPMYVNGFAAPEPELSSALREAKHAIFIEAQKRFADQVLALARQVRRV